MHAPDVFDDPRQAVQQLLSEWVQTTLRDRDHWSGTYPALAAELRTTLGTTCGYLDHIAKLIGDTYMGLAPLLADAASMFRSMGWTLSIGERTVQFSRSA